MINGNEAPLAPQKDKKGQAPACLILPERRYRIEREGTSLHAFLGTAGEEELGSRPPFRRPTEAEFAEAARRASIDRYSRLQSRGGRVAALNKLRDQLVDDARLYDSGDLQDQRDAVAHTLLAVIDFLRAQGFAPETLGPLVRPVHALAERENNSIDQMFAERARAGRPKATLTQHERTGILAAFAEFWIRSHLDDARSQPVKLAEAARKLRGRWFGQVSGAQLEAARNLVCQESKDHPTVKHMRTFYTGIVHAAEKFGIENAFPIMIHMLNDNRASFGLGEGGISKTPRVSSSDND